jgi:uncharacterized protein (DUF305 family)
MSTPQDTPGRELDEREWFAADALVAPAGAVPLSSGDDPVVPPAAPPAGSGWRGPTWAQVIVLAIAIGFLGGAVGYVVGKGRPPSDDSVDVGFLQDMIDHHEQGIVMARSVLRRDMTGDQAVEPIVRSIAEEIILIQQREIGLMDAQLSFWGKVRGDLDREAMGWMGMGSTVTTMPGMQTQEALDALDAATGSEADRLFLTMMRDHHRGGVHMAQDAAHDAGSSRVRALAGRIARSQQSEIDEYTGILARLGLEG